MAFECAGLPLQFWAEMSIDQAFEKVSRVEALLRDGLPDVIRVSGGDLCAAIADRVINEGRGANGQAFRPYSDRGVPAFFYFGRSRSAAGESRMRRAAKERKAVSYREFRAANNLPTGIKNFSFTNDMWRHFGVKGVKPSANGYTLTIGGTTPAAQNKIRWNSEKEGRSIIDPNPEEKGRIVAVIVETLKRAING